jgi:hypothetical protein
LDKAEKSRVVAVGVMEAIKNKRVRLMRGSVCGPKLIFVFVEKQTSSFRLQRGILD